VVGELYAKCELCGGQGHSCVVLKQENISKIWLRSTLFWDIKRRREGRTSHQHRGGSLKSKCGCYEDFNQATSTAMYPQNCLPVYRIFYLVHLVCLHVRQFYKLYLLRLFQLSHYTAPHNFPENVSFFG
jgi:hypothetical protein